MAGARGVGTLSGRVAGRREWPLAGLLFVAVLLLYLFSMPKTVVLEDDGAFILAAWANGVAHPPGYPLFTLIGHLFAQWPWGTVAARVHAVSAFFGALSCALFYLVALRLLGSRLAAATAAGTLAGSSIFWSQAIVAEVYTLNTAFFLLLFLLALRYRERGGRGGLALLALVYGLSLANHWPLIALSTPALLALVANRWREIARAWWWVVPLAGLGLIPYLWMYWNSRLGGITFLGPLEGWRELRYYVSREAYAGVDHHPAADWRDKLAYAEYALRLIPAQFSWLAATLGGVGLLVQRRFLPPTVIVATVLGIAGSTVVLALLLGFEDEPLYRSVFRVYPMVAFALSALWIGCGVRWVAERLAGRGAVARDLAVGAAVVAVASTLIANGPENYRHGDRWALDYARVLLESLPPEAVLFLSADTDSGPVGYLHHVEGVRPDVTLYHTEGNLFPNRLFNPIRTTREERDRVVARFVEGSTRPVFFIEVPESGWGRESFWLYSRAIPDGAGVRFDHLRGSPLYAYFERIVRLPQSYDPWTVMHRQLLISDMVPALAGRVLLDPAGSARDQENLRRATARFEGKLTLLQWLLARDDPRWWGLFEREMAAAGALVEQAFTHRQRAELPLLIARYRLLRGDRESARERYLQSMAWWPAPGNPAYREYRDQFGGLPGGE